MQCPFESMLVLQSGDESSKTEPPPDEDEITAEFTREELDAQIAAMDNVEIAAMDNGDWSDPEQHWPSFRYFRARPIDAEDSMKELQKS